MEHYYSKEQTSTVKLKEINAFLRGKPFRFYLSGGLFSKNKVDFGTELLCSNMVLKKNWTLLDLGCGAGIIGIVASRFVKKVYLSDVNERACGVSKLNIRLNKVDNAHVMQSDLFDNLKDMVFDSIVLNPPQSAGRALCFRMIEQSTDHLKKGGLLQIVARHNKGGKELYKKMKDIFLGVDSIVKSGGYRVYVGYKS